MSERTVRISRRGFLGGASAGLVALGALPYGCGSGGGRPKVEGDILTLRVEDYSELQTVGGYLVLEVDGGFELIVARASETEFLCLSAICTHQRCEVEYEQAESRFYCPCHGSTFDESGAVTWGPATEPLASYPTDFDGERITVDLSAGPA